MREKADLYEQEILVEHLSSAQRRHIIVNLIDQ